MRFAIHNVTRAVVNGLKQQRIDVLSVPQAGTLGATDEQQLVFARHEGRVIFTHDDVLRLAAQGKERAGIVYSSQQ